MIDTIIPRDEVDYISLFKNLEDIILEKGVFFTFNPEDTYQRGPVAFVPSVKQRFALLYDKGNILIKPTAPKQAHAALLVQWEGDKVSDLTWWILYTWLHEHKFINFVYSHPDYIYKINRSLL